MASTLAHDDGFEYMVTIAPNSPLNPRATALQTMACYFGGSGKTASNIQAWYSYDNEPVMVYETNAGDLGPIDYYEWVPNATIPSGVETGRSLAHFFRLLRAKSISQITKPISDTKSAYSPFPRSFFRASRNSPSRSVNMHLSVFIVAIRQPKGRVMSVQYVSLRLYTLVFIVSRYIAI